MEELFNFKGKIGRLEYFQVSALCYLILYTYISILTATFKTGLPWLAYFVLIFTLILLGGVISIKTAAVAGRLRDLNLHPALTFIIFIPAINILFSFYLLFARGQKKLPVKVNQEEEPEVKSCIYCCAKIPYQAKKCMYCGEWVDIESFEEEINKPNNYWTANIILAVLITGLSFLPVKTDLATIFSKDAFKTKNLSDYYVEAQNFCKKFDFEGEIQKYHCVYTYMEDIQDSKIHKELLRINHNCRALYNEDEKHMDCVTKAIQK